MILNFAFDSLKIKKHRQHFNEFMINFHNFRHEKKDDNTITTFVKELKKEEKRVYRKMVTNSLKPSMNPTKHNLKTNPSFRKQIPWLGSKKQLQTLLELLYQNQHIFSSDIDADSAGVATEPAAVLFNTAFTLVATLAAAPAAVPAATASVFEDKLA